MTDVKMTDAAAAKVREHFRDLSQEFSNSRMDVGTYAFAVFSAAGEFGPSISDGTDTFELSWKETFDVCHTASALIAGNTNTFKVELDRLDQDYAHIPHL